MVAPLKRAAWSVFALWAVPQQAPAAGFLPFVGTGGVELQHSVVCVREVHLVVRRSNQCQLIIHL